MVESELIENLIDALKRVPGIGSKSAERIAYEFIKMDNDKVENLISSLHKVKTELKKCPICNTFLNHDKCPICSDETRNQDTLIIVNSFKDLQSIEKLQNFHTLYHILPGLISPSKGVTPEDIEITNLINRIKQGSFKEIIIAVDPTVEGEITSLYISKLLENENIVVSRLGYGLPMGASLTYCDDLTLTRALQNRTTYKK